MPTLAPLRPEEPTCTTVCGLPAELGLSGAEARRLAGAFKALGHPVRLQIVELLSRQGGQVCVCEIEQNFPLSQPTISHHFKVLREAGLIDAEQRGLWVYYHIRREAFTALRAILEKVESGQAVAP